MGVIEPTRVGAVAERSPLRPPTRYERKQPRKHRLAPEQRMAAAELQRLINEAGNQFKFARWVGATPEYVRKWRSGYQMPGPFFLWRIIVVTRALGEGRIDKERIAIQDEQTGQWYQLPGYFEREPIA